MKVAIHQLKISWYYSRSFHCEKWKSLVVFICVIITDFCQQQNNAAALPFPVTNTRHAPRHKDNGTISPYLRVSSLNSTSHTDKALSGAGSGFPPATSESPPAVWHDPPPELVLGYITGAEKYHGSDYLTPGQLISGAITYAVQRVNENPRLLPNTTLRFLIAETHGYEIESIQQTALLIHQNISAIIGPQETCVHEARLAAAFNVPMISYVSITKMYSTMSCCIQDGFVKYVMLCTR